MTDRSFWLGFLALCIICIAYICLRKIINLKHLELLSKKNFRILVCTGPVSLVLQMYPLYLMHLAATEISIGVLFFLYAFVTIMIAYFWSLEGDIESGRISENKLFQSILNGETVVPSVLFIVMGLELYSMS